MVTVLELTCEDVLWMVTLILPETARFNCAQTLNVPPSGTADLLDPMLTLGSWITFGLRVAVGVWVAVGVDVGVGVAVAVAVLVAVGVWVAVGV